jgi:hypothetical protein
VVGIDGGLVREPLSGAAARRLACDAEVIPVVLGGAGEVLDVGRARRTATPAQRRALRVRDGGCIGPGCERPPAWTKAHHLQHWADGGRTDIDNLCLLCTFHHDQVHHHGWTITMRNGRPHMRPPPEP